MVAADDSAARPLVFVHMRGPKASRSCSWLCLRTCKTKSDAINPLAVLFASEKINDSVDKFQPFMWDFFFPFSFLFVFQFGKIDPRMGFREGSLPFPSPALVVSDRRAQNVHQADDSIQLDRSV